MKRCKVCRELKPLDDFYRSSGMADGHRNDCKACNLAAKARRYVENPEAEIARVKRWQQENASRLNEYRRRRRLEPAVKAMQRASHLRRKYGITLADYARMLEEQDGGCGICGKPPAEGASLHVDHDHETNGVRGLLCFTCNNALGDFNDDPARLRAAMHYLSRYDAGVRDEVALVRDRVFALVAR